MIKSACLPRSVTKSLKVPSLARSVSKPLKVPSLARSMPKTLKVPSIARSVPKPLKVGQEGEGATRLSSLPTSYSPGCRLRGHEVRLPQVNCESESEK